MTTCPNCNTAEHVRGSEGHDYVDGLARLIGLYPFRCDVCRARFFRFAKPQHTSSSNAASSKPLLSWPRRRPRTAEEERKRLLRKLA